MVRGLVHIKQFYKKRKTPAAQAVSNITSPSFACEPDARLTHFSYFAIKMNQVNYTNMMKDCLAGIRTSIHHLLWLFNQFTSKISVHVSPPDENETVSHKSKNDEMNRSRLKVVGVGFGRTGTVS